MILNSTIEVSALNAWQDLKVFVASFEQLVNLIVSERNQEIYHNIGNSCSVVHSKGNYLKCFDVNCYLVSLVSLVSSCYLIDLNNRHIHGLINGTIV